MPTVREDVAFGPAQPRAAGRRAGGAGGRGRSSRSAWRSSRDRPPHHLSFGQRRRVAVATVLAMEPEILVLDEPSSNLDPASRRELADILRSLDVTVLMVTHDLPYALELCPRSLILSDGRDRGRRADRRAALRRGADARPTAWSCRSVRSAVRAGARPVRDNGRVTNEESDEWRGLAAAGRAAVLRAVRGPARGDGRVPPAPRRTRPHLPAVPGAAGPLGARRDHRQGAGGGPAPRLRHGLAAAEAAGGGGAGAPRAVGAGRASVLVACTGAGRSSGSARRAVPGALLAATGPRRHGGRRGCARSCGRLAERRRRRRRRPAPADRGLPTVTTPW